MATIIKGAAVLRDGNSGGIILYDTTSRDADIVRYWGALERERRFPIAFWKLRQMFNASNTDEVALRVTEISNPDYAEGRWIVFDGNFEDDLINDPNDDTYYFVLDESVFLGRITIDPATTIDGLMGSVDFPYRSIVWGRIAIAEDLSTFTAYFDAADAPTLDNGGAGGGGATSGIRLPPGG